MKFRLPLTLAALTFFALISVLSPKAVNADFSDSFTNSNGTALTSHNSSVYSQQGSDPAVTIQSNAIAPNQSTTLIANNAFQDGCMSMDWTGNSNNTNMMIRTQLSGGVPNEFYGFLQHNNNGDWLLRGWYSGSYHTIASGNTSFAGTHTYKLCAEGSTISVYKDGSLLGSGTDTGITGSGTQTFYSTGNTLDNLEIDNAVDFSDSFTNTNGTYLTSHNSNVYAQYGSDPVVQIQSNAIAPNQSTTSIINNGFQDGCMSMDWTGNSNNTNMLIRVQANGDYYNFIQNNNNGDWMIQGYYNSSFHTVASGNTSFSGTHTAKLCAIGSTISAYKDGNLLGSGTDTGITGSGTQSFYSTGNTLDNLLLSY